MRFAVGWWRPTRRASSASWRRMLVRRTGATAFLRCGARFARRCSDTHAWRRSHQGQNPSGAKALVSSLISRRSSSGGFETVRITFTGSDALTRAVSGITEAWLGLSDDIPEAASDHAENGAGAAGTFSENRGVNRVGFGPAILQPERNPSSLARVKGTKFGVS